MPSISELAVLWKKSVAILQDSIAEKKDMLDRLQRHKAQGIPNNNMSRNSKIAKLEEEIPLLELSLHRARTDGWDRLLTSSGYHAGSAPMPSWGGRRSRRHRKKSRKSRRRH